MLLSGRGCSSLLALACALAAFAPASLAQSPALEVLRGKPRVFVGEAWLELAPGASLPQALAPTSLSLGPDSAARLCLRGAGVELRGPLEVDSCASQAWALRVQGSGRVHFEARTTRLQIELPGTAWVELGHGIAWLEGLPEGGWRVGCDAGEPLRLRPPPGVHWSGPATLAPGDVLRVVPAHVAPPAHRRPAAVHARAWSRFSWPWYAPAIPESGAGWGGLERAGAQAAAQALSALCTARTLAR